MYAPAPAPSALVGRDRELAILSEQLDAAIAGRGSLVLINGEAGIGKTVLTEALCQVATVSAACILTGRCFDLTETPVYGPWRYLFERYRPAPNLPACPAAFADPTMVSAVESQVTLYRQVRDFLAMLTAARPVVLILDDLHWADPASLDLLRFLARSVETLPLLLIGTYRDDELMSDTPLYRSLPALIREARAVRVDLRPLETAAVRLLITVRYALRAVDGDRLVAYVQARGEGNPFYIGELLRALEETGALRRGDAGWDLGDLGRARIPRLLRQVIDARLDHFDVESQRLLRIAAVIGHEIPLDVWASVGGRDADVVLHVAARALDARLLTDASDGARVQFAHALVREALYESIPAIHRRRIHVHAGALLAAACTPDVDAVAYHFRRADDDRAVAWLIQAGEAAQRVFAWPTAVERYEEALSVAGAVALDDRERSWLRYRIARLLRHTDRPRAFASVAEAERNAEAADDRALRIAARFTRGQLLCRDDRNAEGVPIIRDAIAALATLSADEIAQIDRQEATSTTADFRGFHIAGYGWHGRHAELREVVAAAPIIPAPVRAAATAGDAEPWLGIGTDGYTGVAIMHAHEGRPAAAKAALARSLALARDGFEIDARCAHAYRVWFVLVPYETDAVVERRAAVAAAEALGRQGAGIVSAYIPGETAALYTDVLTGRWDEAERVLPGLIARGDSYSPHAREVYGRLKRLRGHPDEAWEQVRRVLPAGPMALPGSATYEPAMRALRLAAALALDADDLATANAWLDAHDRWLAWNGAILGRSEGHALWSRYDTQSGDPTVARMRAERALAAASEPRQPHALLTAHRLLGELDTEVGRHADADRHLQAALALATACAAPYERALTLLAIAELRAKADIAAAHGVCAEARAIFTALDARPALAHLDRLAARLTSAIPVAGHPAGLTDREVEVLRLVAAGYTNRQIAEALFLAEKTVKNHVTHILTKIAAQNRAAAVGFALRHGLA
jgi:DNA-binding CsgD family transcriptional regulator